MAPRPWLPVLAALLPASALAADRTLPAELLQYPFTVQSLSVGHPNAGFQVRAKLLRESPLLKIKEGSEPYAFGHPALVLMLARTAKQMDRAVPGSRMLVGDLSREHGGRLRGHFSHQSGRDADVGFYARDAEGKPAQLDRFVRFDAAGRARNQSGLTFDDYRNWLLVQSWVRDERAGLSHIFVSRELRARLLNFASNRADFRPFVERAAKLLKQPENADPHDDHFHVRIACPESQLGPCKNESKRGR